MIIGLLQKLSDYENYVYHNQILIAEGIYSWDTFLTYCDMYCKAFFVYNNIANVHSQTKALKKPERRRVKKMIFLGKIFESSVYLLLLIFGYFN